MQFRFGNLCHFVFRATLFFWPLTDRFFYNLCHKFLMSMILFSFCLYCIIAVKADNAGEARACWSRTNIIGREAGGTLSNTTSTWSGGPLPTGEWLLNQDSPGLPTTTWMEMIYSCLVVQLSVFIKKICNIQVLEQICSHNG